MPPRRQRARHYSPDPEEHIPVDFNRHVCLRFGRAWTEARYQLLQAKRFNDAHHLTWDPLISLNINEWVYEHLPLQWRRLLTTPSRQYRELTLEFYATYDVTSNVGDLEAQSITFRMRGEAYELSLSDFATRLGIYEVEELPELLGSTVPTTDVERAGLWTQLSGHHLYDSTTYKASNIRDPRIRILHRVIATAFYGRTESVGNANHRDLNILNALLSGRFLCPARLLAEEFTWMSGRTSNQAISGGAFITRLARGLGVNTDDLTEVGRNIPLTLQTLRNIRVVGSQQGRLTLLTKDGREWIEGEVDGASFGVDDIPFHSTPLGSTAGPSEPPPPIYQEPLRTERPQSPPPGPSYDFPPYRPYYPPQSFYDDVSDRLGRIEVNQTNLWEYTHQHATNQDERMNRLEDYVHQQTDVQNQRWGETQSYYARQQQQWDRQAEFYRRQEEAWAQFTGIPPGAIYHPPPPFEEAADDDDDDDEEEEDDDDDDEDDDDDDE